VDIAVAMGLGQQREGVLWVGRERALVVRQTGHLRDGCQAVSPNTQTTPSNTQLLHTQQHTLRPHTRERRCHGVCCCRLLCCAVVLLGVCGCEMGVRR